MSPDAAQSHYSMILEWDREDQIIVVTAPELPGCRTHGSTYEDAVRQGRDAIVSWIDAAHARGRPIPSPRMYSATAR
jgi:predicted RNase H-like HicB family nuclease